MKKNKDNEKKEPGKVRFLWEKIKLAWLVVKTDNVFAFVDDGKKLGGLCHIGNKHDHLDMMACALYDKVDKLCKDITGKPIVDVLEERKKMYEKVLKVLFASMDEMIRENIKTMKEMGDPIEAQMKGETLGDSDGKPDGEASGTVAEENGSRKV